MTDALAERFRTFAEAECRDTSPLYRILSLLIAEDGDLLKFAAEAPPDQPAPNLLFASVHYLLLTDTESRLRDFYASLVAHPLPLEDSGEPFHEFCRDHAREIQELMSTRLVQTNEVRRSIYLRAAFARISQTLDHRPLALIEIGTSAELNLLWDQYRYHFEGHPPFGNAESPLTITSELRGPLVPPLDEAPGSVVERIGIDLNPIISDDAEGHRWLVALTWPEHTERRERLRAALAILAEHRVRMVRGDGVALLPGLLDGIEAGTVPCIFHTHVANQMTTASRSELLDSIDGFGARRDVVHLHNNIEPHLHATIYRRGERIDLPLARVDGHARWVEWLDSGPA